MDNPLGTIAKIVEQVLIATEHHGTLLDEQTDSNNFRSELLFPFIRTIFRREYLNVNGCFPLITQ
jgi:hypothetical protein